MKLFLIGLVSLVSVLHFFHNSTPTSTPKQYPHTTVKILDGDTIIYNNEHIRLASINAPEIFHGDKKADCGAYQSMARLEYYLTRIRPVSMLRIERLGKDMYGRTIATIYIDTATTSVNQMLVKEGYAQSYNPGFGIPVPDYSADYQEAINKMAGILDHCSLNNKFN